LLGGGRETVLVAHPARRVTGARLARAEDGELHPSPLEQLRGRLGGPAGTIIERGGAADPVEVFGRRVAGLENLDPELSGPVGPFGLRLAPRVARSLDVAEHLLRFGREARFD